MREYKHDHLTGGALSQAVAERLLALKATTVGFLGPSDYWLQLDHAWELHRYAPDGVTMMNMSWLKLGPREVAAEICRCFLDWTEPTSTDSPASAPRTS